MFGRGRQYNWKVTLPTKQHILDEIRRIAEASGSTPGMRVFERETGIREHEWRGVHWRSWSDALKEAGFEPNKMQSKYSTDEVLKKFAEATKHFGRIPANVDIRMYRRIREDFPSHNVFSNHFGSKAGLVKAFSEWVRSNEEFTDLIQLLPKELPENDNSALEVEGFVYLLKSGDHYKVGRSSNVERRIKEIGIALPEEIVLIHSIRTDDPSGIEAYWHRRFENKRAHGEWFRLATSDVRAFKRRKFQ